MAKLIFYDTSCKGLEVTLLKNNICIDLGNSHFEMSHRDTKVLAEMLNLITKENEQSRG